MRLFILGLLASAVLILPAPPTHAAAFDTLGGGQPDIFGHRGTNIFARENTIEAFRLSSQMGANGFELDVQLTKDNQLVVMHDAHLNTRTNVESVFAASRARADGRYYIADFTVAELKTLTVDNPGNETIFNPALNPFAPPAGYAYKIPTYNEVLDILPTLPAGTKVLTEVKDVYDNRPAAERQMISDLLVQAWTERGLTGANSPIIVQSYSGVFMNDIAQRLETAGIAIPTVLLAGNTWLQENGITTAAQFKAFIQANFANLDGFALDFNLFDILGANDGAFNPNGLDLVELLHELEKLVFAYTLGIPPDMPLFGTDGYIEFIFGYDPTDPTTWAALFGQQYNDLYRLGIDGIITNAPDVGAATRALYAVPGPATGGILLLAMTGMALARGRRAA